MTDGLGSFAENFARSFNNARTNAARRAELIQKQKQNILTNQHREFTRNLQVKKFELEKKRAQFSELNANVGKLSEFRQILDKSAKNPRMGKVLLGAWARSVGMDDKDTDVKAALEMIGTLEQEERTALSQNMTSLMSAFTDQGKDLQERLTLIRSTFANLKDNPKELMKFIATQTEKGNRAQQFQSSQAAQTRPGGAALDASTAAAASGDLSGAKDFATLSTGQSKAADEPRRIATARRVESDRATDAIINRTIKLNTEERAEETQTLKRTRAAQLINKMPEGTLKNIMAVVSLGEKGKDAQDAMKKVLKKSFDPDTIDTLFNLDSKQAALVLNEQRANDPISALIGRLVISPDGAGGFSTQQQQPTESRGIFERIFD